LFAAQLPCDQLRPDIGRVEQLFEVSLGRLESSEASTLGAGIRGFEVMQQHVMVSVFGPGPRGGAAAMLVGLGRRAEHSARASGSSAMTPIGAYRFGSLRFVDLAEWLTIGTRSSS
jgi:hypothetical protein